MYTHDARKHAIMKTLKIITHRKVYDNVISVLLACINVFDVHMYIKYINTCNTKYIYMYTNSFT